MPLAAYPALSFIKC